MREDTERDVEALTKVARAAGWIREDAEDMARLACDWYAPRITEARREGADEVIARVEAMLGSTLWEHTAWHQVNAPAMIRAALRGDA